MPVQSINQISQNNQLYFVKQSNQTDLKTYRTKSMQDKFFNSKVSFGASIEYYAKQYLHCSDYESALRDAIKSEYSGLERAGLWLNGEWESTISSRVSAVKSRIRELENEIASAERKRQEDYNYLRYRERETDRETERVRKRQDELTKGIKLKEIKSRKDKLNLEKGELDLEEKNITLEKELLQDLKFSDYSDNLKAKFINIAQLEKANKDKQINIFPNGIMLNNFEEKSGNELGQWLAKRSDCKLKKIDFANLTADKVLESLSNIANEAQKNGNRTLVYIENFDKFAKPTAENEKIIEKLKNFLQHCAEKYKCTVIVNVKTPKDLDAEIIADHRFKIKLTQIIC